MRHLLTTVIATVMSLLALAAPAAAQSDAFDRLQARLGDEPSATTPAALVTTPDLPGKVWISARLNKVPSIGEIQDAFREATAEVKLDTVAYWTVHGWASRGVERSDVRDPNLTTERAKAGRDALLDFGYDARIGGEMYGPAGPEGRGIEFEPYLRRTRPTPERGSKGDRGDKGERGERGARGEKGDPGQAPISLIIGGQARFGELTRPSGSVAIPEGLAGLRWQADSWFVEAPRISVGSRDFTSWAVDGLAGRVFAGRVSVGVGVGTWKWGRWQREVGGSVDHPNRAQAPGVYGLAEAQVRLVGGLRMTIGGALGPWESATPTGVADYSPLTGWAGVSYAGWPF
ncbi:MAG: hypothetical protein HYV34_00660 [Candidatus Kerfeldbacteria bacterium]|nr:hypothetical protein [Candidatus Kerfeldbacteria bacterium]